jgi:hypothetical protein
MQRESRIPVLVAVYLGTLATTGAAAEIKIDHPDIQVRWDTSVRYNAGVRMEDRNSRFENNAGTDETERSVRKGSLVTNRLDLVSEIDVIYNNETGVRVSAAGWVDKAYDRTSNPNPALPSGSNYLDRQYNAYARRYVLGPSGEVLDAFVFAGFNLGDTIWKFKLGQHNVYWGESLFSASNGISYSQGAINTIKAATSPGSEAKELFMPHKQVSLQAQLSASVSLGAQYALDWKPYRLVPGGTFFAPSDGSRSDFASAPLVNGADIAPGSKRGNFGVNLRWNADWLGGVAGIYYRKFDEKLPWSVTQLALNPSTGRPAANAVRLVFPRDTEMLGLTLSTTVAGGAIGTELSYRRNAALQMRSGIPTTAASASNGLTYAEAEGARGTTVHGLINGVWLMPGTPLWTNGSVSAEINFSHLVSVDKNAARFHAEGYGCPAGQDRSDGCATRNAAGTNLSFTPEWPQFVPGWDLAMPTTAAYQFYGNGSALGGGNQGQFTGSLGLTAKFQGIHEFSLKYADTRIRYKTNPLTGLVSTSNGTNPVQNDHAWLSFTYKTVF